MKQQLSTKRQAQPPQSSRVWWHSFDGISLVHSWPVKKYSPDVRDGFDGNFAGSERTQGAQKTFYFINEFGAKSSDKLAGSEKGGELWTRTIPGS